MPQTPVRAAAVLTLAALAAVAGCSRADPAPPIATVSFTASKSRVPIGSPLVMTYRFEVAQGAQIASDYRVFVHVTNPDGTTMWNDDHEPPVPTSQWTPGQVIEYARTRFVPAYPYQGEAAVEVGLYRDNDRLPLAGPEPADRESISRSYRVGSLHLLPQTENIFVLYKNGWHAAEFSAENTSLEWQWTGKAATLSFRNPRNDINFYIEYDARSDLFSDRPQQITVYSGEHAVETFAAETSAPALRVIPITQAQLGDAEMAELRIEVDRTFVPARLPAGGKDARELGIRVYHAFVEGR